MKRPRILVFATLLVALLLTSTLGSAQPAAPETTGTTVHLPLMLVNAPWRNPFGVQANPGHIVSTLVRQRAVELGVRWIRLDSVSWEKVQPTRDAPYDWSALSWFEQELIAANDAGLRPIVIVNDSPHWATINVPWPTSCGAIRADRFADFAALMAALAERYSKPPYNLHDWEMGNEPDVDPAFVPADAVWGCWGNRNDPYYGGEHYGNMLKAVTPAIRAADPHATIWLGGLLLNTYASTTPGHGNPERFLEGVLRAGAAPYFDIVPYHAHSVYQGRFKDHSGLNGGWTPYGGPAFGKPIYLRTVMAKYGVDKPLVLNEAALGICDSCTPTADFYQAQADHVARTFVRTLAADVDGAYWFTLDGPSWRYSGLLDQQRNPQPAFYAFETLITQLEGATLPPVPVDYGPGVEAYRFSKGGRVVDVLWAPQGGTYQVSVPLDKWIAAYPRNFSAPGSQPITPQIVGSEARLNVGFSPIYISRTR